MPRQIADEPTSALVGVLAVRLDHTWRRRAGYGPYLALTYRDLGGAELFGLAIGFDAFAGK